jgi:hypothetical protein
MNVSIHKTARFFSLFSLLLGVLGCTIYYFDKDAGLGTLIYFYVLIIGLASILSLIVVLFFCSYKTKDRRNLLATISLLIVSYILLVFAMLIVT